MKISCIHFTDEDKEQQKTGSALPPAIGDRKNAPELESLAENP